MAGCVPGQELLWIGLAFCHRNGFFQHPPPLKAFDRMRKVLARFDDALIERLFQPLADTLSDRIGLNRSAAACRCLDAASIAWILSQAGALSDAVTRWDAESAFPRIVLLLLGLAALSSLRTLFRRIGAGQKANPLRVAMQPHRCVVLVLLVATLPEAIGLGGLADLAMLGFATCALYIGACATRPPVERRAPRVATARHSGG